MAENNQEIKLEKWKRKRRIYLLIGAIIFSSIPFIRFYFYHDVPRLVMLLFITVIFLLSLDRLLKIERARILGEKPKKVTISSKRKAGVFFILACIFYSIVAIGVIINPTPNYPVILIFFLIGLVSTTIGISFLKKK